MSTPATVTHEPGPVERAARAYAELALTRDGYEPQDEASWRSFWDSPSADRLREEFTVALAASGLVPPGPTA